MPVKARQQRLQSAASADSDEERNFSTKLRLNAATRDEPSQESVVSQELSMEQMRQRLKRSEQSERERCKLGS